MTTTMEQLDQTSRFAGYSAQYLRQCFERLDAVVEFYGLYQIGRHGKGDEKILLSVNTDKIVLRQEYEQRVVLDHDEQLSIESISAETYFCSLYALGYDEFAELWKVLNDVAFVWTSKNTEIEATLTQAQSLLKALKKGKQ